MKPKIGLDWVLSMDTGLRLAEVLARQLGVRELAGVVVRTEELAGGPFEGGRTVESPLARLPGARRRPWLYAPLWPEAAISLAEGGPLLAISRGLLLRWAGPDAVAYALGVDEVPWRLFGPGGAWARGRLFGGARPPRRVFAATPGIAEKVKEAFGINARVLPPPLPKLGDAGPGRGDYFVVVTNLFWGRGLFELVEAFARSKLPLLAVGAGPLLARLKGLAPPNVVFLGQVPDDYLPEVLAGARAFVWPSPHLSLAPLEALSLGVPVITVPGHTAELVAPWALVARKGGWGGILEAVEAFIRTGAQIPSREELRGTFPTPEEFASEIKEALKC